ncbi:nucleoside permease [Flavobacteriaceae bacterium]|uniref:nucleoside permease n=1 Tax=Candidatus Arcticimaribacter forsetii TaxID=2820661 RepID=UPI0020773C9B|nr:nucleoside permease [Candidatus Arcticimaribacter forsetii]MDA8699498.1 nucleoside permease [Flavobacteriaceae bacterium]MDB2346175.1 nucleoside permease [Flavobacteriaceae bacterium]MDB4620416.1 nucleoside permease [Flavobacteriaceae bacterium]MDB4642949.1 nucleoside permease [Flavobacteriaceae bacterium]MDB4674112.1 nucleoside permease [Flavobacteriaceae bacterium]
MNTSTKFQLSLMMFLQFFIWGGWFVTLGTFLGNNLNATGAETGMAFSTQSWGAIIAPFFIGLIADRYFNAEKILGVLHLIGAALMYFMSQATSFDTFYPLVFAYMVAYMPTLALVNSVSFFQMKDPAKEFSVIRVFGTIGWIIAGLLISYFQWDSTESISQGALSNTFTMVAIASLTLGIISFTLPKTPPTQSEGAVSVSDILGLDALKLLKDRNFLMFFITSILICIPLAFYYQQANPFLVELGMENPTGKMTLGQISEVLFMLLLPFFFKKFGFKKTLLVGMLAWAIRYALFAYGNAGELTFMLIIGIALHGICYDFFFVSGQIYTDFKAGEKVKSAAQGLITLATYGVGMLVGFWVAGKISDQYILADESHNWEVIWLIPAAFALGVMVLFMVIFKDEKIELKEE